MRLKFEINKDLLAASALFNPRANKLPGWGRTKQELWDTYKNAYQFYQNKGGLHKFFAAGDYKDQLQQIIEQTDPLIQECISSQNFKDLLQETEEYKNWLKAEWESKKELVIKELKLILKTDLPDDEFKVLVVAPSVGGGSHLSDKKIFWGHEEDWPNYNIVYLMHEALHEYFGKSDIEHAVIELAADNELRIRLNGKGEYFQEGSEKVGHDFLLETEKGLLPEWQKYLESDKIDIFEFVRQIKN